MGEELVERSDMPEVSSITYLLQTDEQAKPRIKHVHTIWKTGFAFLFLGVAFSFIVLPYKHASHSSPAVGEH